MSGVQVVILTVVGTLVLCGGIVWYVLKSMKKDAYQGIIEAKHEEEREGANDSDYTAYYLIVKLDDGTKKRISVGHKVWKQFAVGDRIVKEAGKYNPVKG